MNPYDELYNAFLQALRHFLEKEGHGGRSVLAANVGISNAMLSKMLNNPERTKASLKTQIAIAKIYGYDHAAFIDLGRKLLSGDESEVNVEPPQEIVEAEPPVSDIASDYIENLKQQIADHKIEKGEWKTQKDEWKKQKDEFIAERAEWKEERSELKKEITELKERIKFLEAQLAIPIDTDLKRSAG